MMMASSNQLKSSNSFSVCSLLIACSNSAVPKHLKEIITPNFLLNINSVLASKEIVFNRNYRIGFIDCLLSIFMNISTNIQELKDIQTLTKTINIMELVFIDKDE